MDLTGKLRSIRSMEIKEKKEKRNRISYDYFILLEKGGVAQFKETSRLNAPKSEVIDALLYAIANAKTRSTANAFAAALSTIIYYQDDVGDEVANKSLDLTHMRSLEPDDILGRLNSINFERLAQLNRIATKEHEWLDTAISAAMNANVLIVPWHVKIWHRIAGKGQFSRTYGGYIDFPD